jgi:hypothetical protein
VLFTKAAAAATSETVVVDEKLLTTVPDFSGLAARRVAEECQARRLELNLRGSGLGVEQHPPAGAQVPPRTRVWVRLAR